MANQGEVGRRWVAVVVALVGMGLVGDAAATPGDHRRCEREPAALTLRSPYLDGDGEAALADAIAAAADAADGVRERSEPPGAPFTYLLHVPDGLPNRDVPLLVAMHGLGGHGPQFATQSGWPGVADEHGFIVAFPSGARRWDATEGSPDVTFIRDLVAELRAERCIDARRIWATGHSYGGFMTQRLVCDAGDLFAAGAVVSGGNITTPGLGGPCGAGTGASTRPGYEPVPLAFWHGTDDAIVGYDAGRKSLDGWLARYGCEPAPAAEVVYGSVEVFDDCRRADIAARDEVGRDRFSVRFRTYEGHAHGYPDGCGGLGAVNAEDCTAPDESAWPTARTHDAEILEFLSHQLRDEPAPTQAVPAVAPLPSPSHPADVVAWIQWVVESNRR